MSKNFWFGVMVAAVMAPYMGLKLLGRGIAWLWDELGEFDGDPLIIRGIVMAGIISSGVTIYGHYFVEPHGFMTTEWQMWVALGAVAFGGTALLMLAIIIGGGLSQWVATLRYGSVALAAFAVMALGIIGLLDMPESPATYAWIMATVVLPGLLALGAAGHKYDLWYSGEDDEESIEEGEGNLTP